LGTYELKAALEEVKKKIVGALPGLTVLFIYLFIFCLCHCLLLFYLIPRHADKFFPPPRERIMKLKNTGRLAKLKNKEDILIIENPLYFDSCVEL